MSALDLPAMLHELGRGARGARALSREDTQRLFGAMLAGDIDDLELGALTLAYRIKGETPDELAGMLAAVQAILPGLPSPPDAPIPVVIPSYNGARKLPNLTPLLALLLAQRGIPVLVHGDDADAYERVGSASIFAALGIAACRHVEEIQVRLAARRVAFVPVAVLAPELARLLALRARLGVRGPAHTLAKLIQPFAGPALRLVNYTHPPYRDSLAALFSNAALAGPAGVLLARGSEGEAVADPRRQVAVEWLREGTSSTLIEAMAAVGPAPALPPARDAATTATWIEAALAGQNQIPPSLVQQVQTISAICKQDEITRAATTARRA